MARKKKKSRSEPPVAVVLTKRDWRIFANRVAALETITHALHDVQIQLTALLDLKARHALAGKRAAEARKANETVAEAQAHLDALDLNDDPAEANGKPREPEGGA
jgi:dienelactone hydrolase